MSRMHCRWAVVMLRLVSKIPQIAAGRDERRDRSYAWRPYQHGRRRCRHGRRDRAAGAGAGAAAISSFRLAGQQMQKNLRGAQSQSGSAGHGGYAPRTAFHKPR